MNFDYIIIRYSEIALKGKNRPYFEKVLAGNIEQVLSDLPSSNAKRIRGRILVKIEEDNPDVNKYRKKLDKVFGIENYSFGVEAEQNIETINQTSWG
jgi:thiamine biosynthesis protein ThiI